jgi:hypothetical protein
MSRQDFDVDILLKEATSAPLPEQTEARMQTHLDDFRKRLAAPPKSGRLAAWLARLPRWAAVAAATAAPPVLILIAIGIICLRSAGLLARTAELMKATRSYHYEATDLINPDQPAREFWSQGDKTYCRVSIKDRLVGEAWISPSRFVAYDKESNRVRIRPTDPALQTGLEAVRMVYDFKPSDWKTFPQKTINEDGREWLVVEMPGGGTFSNGHSTSGETRQRLWIDAKTALPDKLESLLRSAPGAEWKPFLLFRFLWDNKEVPDSLFEPNYPATATVTEDPWLHLPKFPPADSGSGILTVSKDGKTGITLEKAWIQPGGLVVLRIAYQGCTPFGEPPRLADPSKNPWGLKPDEIRPIVLGQLILPEGKTEPVASGGVNNRWAGYEVYRFSAPPDGAVPGKFEYRRLLARAHLPADGDFNGYVNAVVNDPSAWGLYEFSIPTEPYFSEQIPEEIYSSPNLNVRGAFLVALRGALAHYEAKSPQAALEFLRKQGPHTQALLNDEMQRLTAK